jgi:hypothetical protein
VTGGELAVIFFRMQNFNTLNTGKMSRVFTAVHCGSSRCNVQQALYVLDYFLTQVLPAWHTFRPYYVNGSTNFNAPEGSIGTKCEPHTHSLGYSHDERSCKYM